MGVRGAGSNQPLAPSTWAHEHAERSHETAKGQDPPPAAGGGQTDGHAPCRTRSQPGLRTEPPHPGVRWAQEQGDEADAPQTSHAVLAVPVGKAKRGAVWHEPADTGGPPRLCKQPQPFSANL